MVGCKEKPMSADDTAIPGGADGDIWRSSVAGIVPIYTSFFILTGVKLLCTTN